MTKTAEKNIQVLHTYLLDVLWVKTWSHRIHRCDSPVPAPTLLNMILSTLLIARASSVLYPARVILALSAAESRGKGGGKENLVLCKKSSFPITTTVNNIDSTLLSSKMWQGNWTIAIMYAV
ncbi:hypothetical protein TNCV_4616061 [Trichonephila clavipes]|nr:hypothetical protein TNCV_4616061 [Trichonephila clavipes]